MKKSYALMTKAELMSELALLSDLYSKQCEKKLALDMSRGKPSAEQLDLSNGMMTVLDGSDCKSENGFDARNYGVLAGLPEARRLIAQICKVDPENVVIGGPSSLEIMYDAVVRAILFGTERSKKPWGKQDKIKFLCPVPGYDRHFGICEDLGIEMINIKMTKDGPNMDEVERLVSSDPTIKGIWCVPKYSNPDGITYSDDTVRRMAALSPAADDFRVFWDNAYIVHDITDTPDKLLNIFDLTVGTKNENLVYMFVSTSKITFPGAGISAFISSKRNVEFALEHLKYQIISYNKVNQLRHVRFFASEDGVINHMKKHSEFLKPRFDTVISALRRELSDLDIASFTAPNGGYFISLYTMPHTARRTGELCRAAGVTLTNVGATYPYGTDPDDSNIRIAPSYPSVEELKSAMEVLCICVRLAAVEKLLSEKGE